MNKHTPGPWRLGKPDPIGVVGGGMVRVTLFAGDDTESRGPSKLGDLLDDEALPNARLIAAAPELLEAVKELYGFVESGVLQFNDFGGAKNLPKALARTKKVILKAERKESE